MIVSRPFSIRYRLPRILHNYLILMELCERVALEVNNAEESLTH